jgi:uncharacterized protein
MTIRNKTWLFLVFVFGISFLAAGIFYLAGGRLDRTEGLVFAVLYMFFPLISALIVEKLIYKENIKKPFLISFRLNSWFLVSWLLPPLIILGSLGICLLFPGISWSPGMEGMFERYEEMMTPEQIEEMRRSLDALPLHPLVFSLLSGLLAGITINAVAAFGEELGWRGFLVRRFQNMNFINASLLTGLIWGLWHAPMILMGHNYPNYPVAGIFMMTIMTLLFSPLFLYITIKTGSVIAASVMHGTLNGTAGLSIMMISGGNELTVGITGVAGFLSILLFTVLFYLYDSIISREKIMTGTVSRFLKK